MSRLTRDGTPEPVSRDQILRHERGQGNIHFPCSAAHKQDWQLTQLIHTLLYVMTIHTRIHPYQAQRRTNCSLDRRLPPIYQLLFDGHVVLSLRSIYGLHRGRLVFLRSVWLREAQRTVCLEKLTPQTLNCRRSCCRCLYIDTMITQEQSQLLIIIT